MERVKYFCVFHHWIRFKYVIVNLELFIISIYKTALHNCKVDCVMNLIAFHVKLSFLEVHFSMLGILVVVHVTSNSKKLLCGNF